MKQILEERDDIVFYIKLLPLKVHSAAYSKSKTIVCEKSLRLLERALDGYSIPDPKCETTEVDDTIELAERLGITGTPAIVLPDGAVVGGFKDAVSLVKLIEAAGKIAEDLEAREAEARDDAEDSGGADGEEGYPEDGDEGGPGQDEGRGPGMFEPESPSSY